jgi:hypothetical protein
VGGNSTSRSKACTTVAVGVAAGGRFAPGAEQPARRRSAGLASPKTIRILLASRHSGARNLMRGGWGASSLGTAGFDRNATSQQASGPKDSLAPSRASRSCGRSVRDGKNAPARQWTAGFDGNATSRQASGPEGLPRAESRFALLRALGSRRQEHAVTTAGFDRNATSRQASGPEGLPRAESRFALLRALGSRRQEHAVTTRPPPNGGGLVGTAGFEPATP